MYQIFYKDNPISKKFESEDQAVIECIEKGFVVYSSKETWLDWNYKIKEVEDEV